MSHMPADDDQVQAHVFLDTPWEDAEDVDDADGEESEPLEASEDDFEAHGGCGAFNAPA